MAKKKTKRPDGGKVPYVHLRGKRWWYQRRSEVVPGGRLYIRLNLRIDAPIRTVELTAGAISERIDFGDKLIIKGLKKNVISPAELVAAKETGRFGQLRRRALGPIKLGKKIDDWLEVKKDATGSATLANLRSHTNRLRERLGDDFDMTALTTSQAQAFLRGPAEGLSWEFRTQKTRRGTYRALWSYAMQLEVEAAREADRDVRFPENPWTEAKLAGRPPRKHEESAALENELTFELLRAAAAHSRKRLVWFILTFSLGGRSLEVRQIETSHVERTSDGFEVKIMTLKGGPERKVTWPARFNSVMEAYLEEGAGEKYLIQSPSPRRGGMYGPDQPREWLKELCKLTGIEYGRAEGIVVHSGRHTAATAWLKEGMTIAQVAAVLGNTAAEVARTYDHLRSEDVKAPHSQAMERILGGLELEE